MCSPLGRIGCWWSEKKSRKFNVQEFSDVCRKYGFELIKIDLNSPLEDQGPFVAIVHKLTDIILQADKGDLQATSTCKAFQKYIDDHPEVIVIDSLPNIKKLNDRYIQYNCAASDLSKKVDVFIPAFVELNTTDIIENMAKLKAAGVNFPIVCKPTLAHGKTAHQMSIIFNEDGLKDVSPPCVAQKFINHNAVLYKLFTIGAKYFIIERPSLKNFTAGDQKTIFFNSHEISKPHSASELNELDDDEQRTPYLFPEKEKMDSIVETLFSSLGINLLGIDFIIDNKTGYYGVVDINVFPGYDEVEDFFTLLCELIVTKISLKAAGKDETDFRPVLLNSCIRTFHGYQKFSSDSTNILEEQSKTSIPNTPSCYCCPISSVCLNGLHPSRKNSRIISLTETCMDPTHFHSQDCAQDDSGIETSDSCDEKKESCHRTPKRLHFRMNSAAFAVDGFA